MIGIFEHILFLLRGVKSYALVGSSGTGKSFRAKLVAQKYGVDLIIDDGLLIRGDQILAGRSAKKDPTYLGAIKTALFDDREQREMVSRALQHERFRRFSSSAPASAWCRRSAIACSCLTPSKS
jgi:hypothetical protein